MVDETRVISGPPKTVAPDLSVDSVALGDAAAARGDWVEAVATWERLLVTPDRASASQRIRWFLAETGAATSGPGTRVSRRQVLVTGVVFAMIGTTCVLLGQAHSGGPRNALSATAWALYIASAALAVSYAFLGADGPIRTDDVTKPELLEARAVAVRLESNRSCGVRKT